MHFRIATNSDSDDIRNVYSHAFNENEKDIVSNVAINLLSERTTPQTISLVAETDDTLVGHIAFSPVRFDNDDSLIGYILAPLAVLPDYQKQLVGSRLIENGKAALEEMGVNILFVYGDPEYYRRFGFGTDNAERFIPKHKLQYPSGWQSVMLNKFSTEGLPSNIECVASLDDPELW